MMLGTKSKVNQDEAVAICCIFRWIQAMTPVQADPQARIQADLHSYGSAASVNETPAAHTAPSLSRLEMTPKNGQMDRQQHMGS